MFLFTENENQSRVFEAVYMVFSYSACLRTKHYFKHVLEAG